MASDLGESISDQKKRFCGLDQGPRSTRNVLHIVDLCYVPSHEKEIVKDFCVKAAGSPEGILFINTKTVSKLVIKLFQMRLIWISI